MTLRSSKFEPGSTFFFLPDDPVFFIYHSPLRQLPVWTRPSRWSKFCLRLFQSGLRTVQEAGQAKRHNPNTVNRPYTSKSPHWGSLEDEVGYKLTGRQLLSALRCILSMFSMGLNRRMWLSTPRNAFIPSNSCREDRQTDTHCEVSVSDC